MPTPTCFGNKVPLSGSFFLSTAKFVGPSRFQGAHHHHCNRKVNISASTCLHCHNNKTSQRSASLVTHSQRFVHPALCTQTSVSMYDPTVSHPAEDRLAIVQNTCWIYELVVFYKLADNCALVPKHVGVGT
jgi:hypothetical protein